MVVLSVAGEVTAQQLASGDLARMTLEDLMRIDVTSASRHEQALFRTPTAMSVITREDIRRSGLNTLPELLRMVPGLSVARIDATKWAISARGFNTNFTNKMLVVFNGRSVYNRLFGGVYWEVWDVSLDEIERIEVIRGPGSSSWGDNAVNGVINIVTRSAFDTKGGYVSGSAGSTEPGALTVRYGGGLGTDGAYRLFGKVAHGNGLFSQQGPRAPDDSKRWAFGGRLDRHLSSTTRLSVEGTSIGSDNGQIERLFSVVPGPPVTSDERATTESHSAQSRWSHSFGPNSELDVFGAFERFSHRHHDLRYGYDVANIEVQHRLVRQERHDFIWGANYRYTTDYVRPGARISVTPERLADGLVSFFAQDAIGWSRKRGQLTVGTRVGHTEFSGWGWQPMVRVLWELTPRQAMWAAASRALRTPSRSDRGLRVNGFSIPGAGAPVVFATLGQSEFSSERLRAIEAGYRLTFGTRVSLDVSAYRNGYSGLATQEPGVPFVEAVPSPFHVVVPAYTSNGLSARTAGIEVSTSWLPVDGWRLEGGYSLFTIDPRPDVRSADSDAGAYDGNAPKHQAFVRSRLTLPGALELDANVLLIGQLRQLAIPGYARLDVRLAWAAHERLELAVVGLDLLDARHVEFGGSDTESVVTTVPRSVRVQATWRF